MYASLTFWYSLTLPLSTLLSGYVVNVSSNDVVPLSNTVSVIVSPLPLVTAIISFEILTLVPNFSLSVPVPDSVWCNSNAPFTFA